LNLKTKGANEMTENMETGSTSGAPSGQDGASGDKSQPPSAVDVKELAAALRSDVEAMVDRKMQSQKDTRIAKLTSRTDTFEERLKRLEELKADGMSEKAALRFMNLEDRLPQSSEAEQTQAQTPQPKAGGTAEVSASKLTQQLTQQLGLDANDPELTSIFRAENEFSVQVATMLALAEKRKRAMDASTNPAQQMPVGGGSAIQSVDKEAIAAEILRLSLDPSKNYARIQELNAKLK